LSGREILTHSGKVSHEEALQKAHSEYELFRNELLKEPTSVERDFLASVKTIESKRKREKKI